MTDARRNDILSKLDSDAERSHLVKQITKLQSAVADFVAYNPWAEKSKEEE